MKYEIKFMKLAENDYEDIFNYLSQFYPRTVKKFLDELDERLEILENKLKYIEFYMVHEILIII